jgi:hypothetical protein
VEQTVLHEFTNGSNGDIPATGLTLVHGNLYRVSSVGTTGDGVIFEIVP